MTPEEIELLKGDMPLKVKDGSDFIALQEGENTYATEARERDARLSSHTIPGKILQDYQDILLSVNEVDYTPNNIIKSLQENIGPYGFVIDNPYKGYAEKFKDALEARLDVGMTLRCFA